MLVKIVTNTSVSDDALALVYETLPDQDETPHSLEDIVITIGLEKTGKGEEGTETGKGTGNVNKIESWNWMIQGDGEMTVNEMNGWLRGENDWLIGT